MKRMVLFDKKYSGESVVDVYRDVDEAFREDFTPLMKMIPKDEYNIHKGTFRVEIIWYPK